MSYATEAEYRAYFLARNVDVTAQLTAAVEAALLVATEYLDDTYDFIGCRTVEAQSYKWPRVSAYTSEGILLANDSVPTKVKDCCCELAYIEQTQTGGLQPDFDGAVIVSQSDSVGSLSTSTTYDSGASEAYERFYLKAIKKIDDLIVSYANSTQQIQRVL